MNSSLFECPCCKNRTLGARASYEICAVCFWEDDGQDDLSADEVWSGPNKDLSLNQARVNYSIYGVCHPDLATYVRSAKSLERS